MISPPRTENAPCFSSRASAPRPLLRRGAIVASSATVSAGSDRSARAVHDRPRPPSWPICPHSDDLKRTWPQADLVLSSCVHPHWAVGITKVSSASPALGDGGDVTDEEAERISRQIRVFGGSEGLMMTRTSPRQSAYSPDGARTRLGGRDDCTAAGRVRDGAGDRIDANADPTSRAVSRPAAPEGDLPAGSGV